MVEVHQIDAAGWRALREVRLEALRDAPSAFASSYAREVAFTASDWQRRIATGVSFLAYAPELDAAAAGIVGGFEAEPGAVELVSLWVRPRARGQGVGRALVEALAGWAWGTGTPCVHLWVTETNHHARRLYDRCGFRVTTERQPLPSDPALMEIGMVRCQQEPP
ncbi:MAG TPA: GNAT family N-acetyltransferase [Streptosporangiaceae bacterium]|nr:GNAT family N-acetyltransferase [Streptosporangiaceae bacterium]